jgi:alpha-L-rhamnosidase
MDMGHVSGARVAFVVLISMTTIDISAMRHGPAPTPAASLAVEGLRTEYMNNPLGIDSRQPRFSWRLRSDGRNVRQAAYQIRVGRGEGDLTSVRTVVWDSGRVTSDASIHRVYAGPALESSQRYVWQVQVWDDRGRASGWSAPASWEMGLLATSDWRAAWIEPNLKEDTTGSPPPPMVRRAFRLDKRVRSARAYVTSHGLYELHVNGRRVGEDVLTPGWTSYKTRLQYQTYDVASLLRQGDNAVGMLLGNGWYRGNIGFEKLRNVYGDRLAALLQIVVTFADGTTTTIGTDDQWKASTGPIVMSEIYHGETYDARLEKKGWAEPGFDDAGWSGVRVANYPKDELIAAAGPPVRRIDTIRPKSLLRTPAGLQVVDMGQNMVGWVRLQAQGPSGTTITLRHAEVLDKDGNFYTENLRRAAQTLRYTLKGGDVETFEPHFTFQGFRYVAVEGYPGTLTLDSLAGIVVHSAIEPTGEFSSSLPLLNQLQHNITWGQKGNFVDVPTDCPQRDERLGWTGDAQAFARTAAFNMQVAGFFTKWLKDLAADQLPNGSVPHVIPDVISKPDKPAAGSAGWGDAAVIIPWTMYLTYGDTRVLADQYPSMTKWVEYMRQRAGDDYVWDGDFHFGDWLAFATTRSDYPGATTSKELIATAFFAHAADLVARTAHVLGKPEDASKYTQLYERVRSAFQQEFVTPEGRVGEATQTAYVLALHFDLLPEGMRANAAARLAKDVRSHKHLTTGFLGTPYLCHVLSRYGYLTEAYMLLERTEYPSWLYPVTKGATTIWERWDGLKPDGTFQDARMNSFNHYAYGAVGDWLYRVMAGLEIDDAAPAYKHVLVQPRPGGSITSASVRYESMYGRVSSAWVIADGRFELTVDVPPNTTATIRLPRAVVSAVAEGGSPLGSELGRSARQDGDMTVLDVGSGRYRFAYPWKN